MKKQVLGIKIDDVNLDEAVKIISSWLEKPGKHHVVTPNPEIVVMAQGDQELKKILNQADLSLPDGYGLKILTDIVCNTPGIDLMEALIKLSSEKGFTVGLLGGRGEVAKKAAECLRKKYQNLKVVFAERGGEVDKDGNTPTTDYRLPTTDLLFVAFGPPKQEKWIAKNLPEIPVKVAMGVGGAFDYLSGEVPRAPGRIRHLGLEWLFRLAVQPWRIKRQLALLKFIWLVLD